MPGKKEDIAEIGLSLPQKVAVIYSDVRREYFPTDAQYITEKDALDDAEIISGYLRALGITPILHSGNAAMPAWLRKENPDLVLNLVDSVKGDESLASSIPGVLELLGIPYTGSGILGLSLDTNKFVIKKLLQQNGVPVPNYQLFNTAEDYMDPAIRFPLISKLNAIHGSVEITDDAVSENEKQLRKRLRRLISIYKQPVLVEEFICGREVTAIVLQEKKKKKVYLAEKIFRNTEKKYQFLTFEDQWLTEMNAAFHYVKFDDPLLKEYVKMAFNVTKMTGYAKFDVRLDQSGRYFFIDSNCNPALGPKELDVALSVILDLHGIEFEETLKRLIFSAVTNSRQKPKLKGNGKKSSGKKTPVANNSLGTIQTADKQPINQT